MTAPCPVDRDCQDHRLAPRLDTRPTSVRLRDAEAESRRLREVVAAVALLDNPGAVVTDEDLASLARAAREVLS